MTLTPSWTKLRYHPVQKDLWGYDGKFAAVVAGRGSGKTELARRKTILSLAIKKPWPNPLYFYVLPTYNQAKRVAWKPLLDLIPSEWIKGYNPKKHDVNTNKEKLDGVNVSDSCITTVFGSSLYVVGMDKPQRIEGSQYDGGVIDECSDQKPGAFKLSILPALSHRNPWCWRIGVPKRAGVGRIEFRDFFDRGLLGEGGIRSFHWKSSTILTDEQLAEARTILDKTDFDEQYNAEWIDAGGTIYHAFSSENIDESVRYFPERTVYVGCDFNVDPMCWILAHRIDNKLYVFDEVFLKNTNTQKTLNWIADKYLDHQAGWKFFGDASSRARKTSADKTDYLIIKNDTQLKDKTVHFPRKNIALRTRFATTNAGLCNANEERSIFIHPRCEKVLKDLKMMSYQEGTTEPENYDGTDIGHMADAFGYLVQYTMRLKVDSSSVPEVIQL